MAAPRSKCPRNKPRLKNGRASGASVSGMEQLAMGNGMGRKRSHRQESVDAGEADMHRLSHIFSRRFERA